MKQSRVDVTGMASRAGGSGNDDRSCVIRHGRSRSTVELGTGLGEVGGGVWGWVCGVSSNASFYSWPPYL
jgi:hypothetical protein